MNKLHLSAKPPKILYHGSNKKIKILEPRQPTDAKKENSIKAVYATDNKKYALAMALTNQKNSESFLTKNPIKLHFVKGTPKMKFVYLHYLKSDNFTKNKKNQYFSTTSTKPIKIEKISTFHLVNLWERSSIQELKKFLKNRK